MMACPTCSHTMAALGVAEREMIFLCPRCGTTRQGGNVYVPKLVERCREFRDKAENGMGLSPASAHLWHRLGIAESIHTPEGR